MGNGWKIILRNVFSDLILIWGALLIYRFAPYYRGFLKEETQAILLLLAIGYSIISPVLCWGSRQKESSGWLVLKGASSFLRQSSSYRGQFISHPNQPLPKLEVQEKNAILFAVVKFFFLPIMINFAISNIQSLPQYVPSLLEGDIFGADAFLYILFPFFLSFFFLVDTAIFSFAYAFEAGVLKNTVRSVEPTLLGWVVALVCYPPFSTSILPIIPWYPNDFVEFSSDGLTIFVRALILLFVAMYLLATVALGTKSSNLTNRGVVDSGPYRFVRHPAYMCKNVVWWLTILPIMNAAVFVSMLAWTFIYFLRAITEERHLIKDPTYQAYCKNVRYRFVPFVY